MSRRPIPVHSNLVLFPVNVVGVRDRQVLGLEREQFRVYDDAVEQSITHFASGDAPVSVPIVFDASASMGPKLRRSREAITEPLCCAPSRRKRVAACSSWRRRTG